ncbi:S1C family serine protease [Desertibacillus haloalkaliphilus]|uniref:S1C family serine protease n=1 Tax=Desertibacillus haloalkaliphilus TaxID=1328930 RepID=UPI001C27BE15|nr:trypsin-like peptidase domain-containing protein [Desertibacillus haloalkaliphilus]MBU8906525.1 S1C family serine protease [Desertibacillus haloalkaliphilus]
MNTKWVISILVTVLIWALGVGGYFYLADSIPNQVAVTSVYMADEEIVGESEGENSFDPKAVIQNTQQLVVMIEVGSTGSAGSGFLYNDKGDIVTNAHVVAGTEKVTVRMADDREYEGTVIGISTDTDVAVVRVPDLQGVEPLPLAAERNAEIADEVIALGSPLGLQNTVTTGIISGVDRSFELGPYHYDNVYQISAPIAPGNSGGPLVDLQTGEVLGINSAGMDQGTIGFSIPMSSVITMLEGWSASPLSSLPNVAGYMDYGYDHVSEIDLATYLIYYFYESINLNDYVTAYSLLGHNWQTGTSYDSFREGYLNTRFVTIDEMDAWEDGNYVSVVAVISAEESRDGVTVISKYKVTYQVGYENDQLKIISGTAEKI